MRKILGYSVGALPFTGLFAWIWIDSDLYTAFKVLGITVLIIVGVVACGYVSAKLINND